MTSRPTRPSFTHRRRPSSAIFLGSNANIPDLPEPPSPGAASNGSGLPSPPATNSTGSGSTENNGSLRRRSVSDSTTSPSPSNAVYSRPSSPDDDMPSDADDNTARLTRRRSSQASSENAAALQRVMSLTQRNRIALDKLSRLNTPSPSLRMSTSPLPPLTGSSSTSGSSSRLSYNSHDPGGRHRNSARSGSETERESHHSASYSSDDQSLTPPSTAAQPLRPKTSSAPSSPTKAHHSGRSRVYSPGASTNNKSTRKQVSVTDSERESEREDENDVTVAALAAVASLRRSPTNTTIGRRSRQPLPREFRERDGRNSTQPTTPHRHASRDRHTIATLGSPSPKSSAATLYGTNQQLSPRPTRAGGSRFASTVRELTRRHQTRWMSEDLTSTTSASVDDGDDDESDRPSGRRQTVRGGSMENVLGTRLVGSGLRAAGIGMRRDGGDDVFGSQESQDKARRARSNGMNPHADWEDDSRPSRTSGPPRMSDRSGLFYDSQTPAPNGSSQLRRERAPLTVLRPATSMAEFHHNDGPSTAPPGLRTYRSSYALDRDREGIGSRQQIQHPYPLQAPIFQERTYGLPRNRPRENTITASGPSKVPSSSDPQGVEHIRLMDESLSVFESLLSRLPSMGETTTATIPELYRNAQSIVRFSEQVNGMLRTKTNRALERQIDSEVADESEAIDMAALWKDVGMDFRDCLRVSDELVRTMTGFLLGVGKVLREAAPAPGTSAALQHLRGSSLDDDMMRSMGRGGGSSTTGSGTGSGKSSADGRRSADARRSWDLAREERDSDKDIPKRASSRADGILARSASSMLRERTRDRGERDRQTREQINLDADQDPSPRNSSSAAGLSAISRRLYTPREHRDRVAIASIAASSRTDLSLTDLQRSTQEYDPSPTPVSRSQAASKTDRHRSLPPLSIPTPLPSLPSESSLNRSGNEKGSRRKVSTASNITVRANPNFNISTSSATTALTPHTVSNNITPDRTAFPMLRNDSGESTSTSAKKNSVTFSRPSTVSVSALNGLQQRDTRKRTISATSSTSVNENVAPVSASNTATTPNVRTPRSGSETERPPLNSSGRRTVGPTRARVSLDAALEEEARAEGSGGDRNGKSAQTQTAGFSSSTRRERRRTVTEIFS